MKQKKEFIDYEKYINSKKWSVRRKAFMNSKPHRSVCRVCGTTENLHVHHTTYKDLGDEKDHHLVTLCQGHHALCHEFVKENNLDLYNGTSKYIFKETNGKHGHNPPSKKKKKQPKVNRKKFTIYMYIFDVLCEHAATHKVRMDNEEYRWLREAMEEVKRHTRLK